MNQGHFWELQSMLVSIQIQRYIKKYLYALLKCPFKLSRILAIWMWITGQLTKTCFKKKKKTSGRSVLNDPFTPPCLACTNHSAWSTAQVGFSPFMKLTLTHFSKCCWSFSHLQEHFTTIMLPPRFPKITTGHPSPPSLHIHPSSSTPPHGYS